MSAPTRAFTHTSAFYAAMFGAFGAHLPFWPVWLEDWGLSPGEVGLYLSLGMLVRVVAGFAIPVIADRLDQRRMTSVLLALAGSVVFLAHIGIAGRSLLLTATLLSGAVIAGLFPLGEALGNAAAKRHSFDYARARAIGSVAFLLANILVGLGIARFGVDLVLLWIVGMLALTAVFGWHHPGGGHIATKPPRFGDIARLMTRPVFALFVLAAALTNSSHAVYYAYGSVHWRVLGLGEGLIGTLWAVSVAIEVVFMMTLGGWLIRRIGPVGALIVAGAGGVVRWTWMMFDPGLVWLWPLQAMHTLTFVCGHLGAMAFIAAAVPEGYSASAQGAYMGFAGGLLTAIGMGLAALVYPHVGGGAYAIAAVMSGLTILFAVMLKRRWSGGQLAF